jgi:hypothetical protein
MTVECGTEVIGVWGAGLPEWQGVVTAISMYPQGTEVDVTWENGSNQYIMESDMRTDYTETVNGIGIHLKPAGL